MWILLVHKFIQIENYLLFFFVCLPLFLLTNQMTQFLWCDISSSNHDNNIASGHHIRNFVCLQSSKSCSTRRLDNKTSIEKCLHCTVSQKGKLQLVNYKLVLEICQLKYALEPVNWQTDLKQVKSHLYLQATLKVNST